MELPTHLDLAAPIIILDDISSLILIELRLKMSFQSILQTVLSGFERRAPVESITSNGKLCLFSVSSM